MLAQNFKTAAELGISEIEVDALIKVLGMLERGELTEQEFSMDTILHDCGSPACLCGWANYVSGGRAFPEAPQTSRLYNRLPAGAINLFLLSGWRSEWESITPSQAATALRSYLTTGVARWDEALAA